MKVVLDTNVIVSGLLFPGGIPDKIVRACLTGQISNATSPDLLTELRRILQKKFNLSEERVAMLLDLMKENSELVYPVERIKKIKADEADNRVLECALTAKVQFIISGDQKHLLKLKFFQDIEILSPAKFFQITHLVFT